MIVVVGGGITGLALGRELARRSVPFRVLEASDRPGGLIRSLQVEGRALDVGPQRLRLTPRIASLVDELGLGDRVLTAPADLPLFVLHQGRLGRVPFSWSQLARTRLLSPAGKLRLLMEPLSSAPRADESVADCFQRKLGREGYVRVAGPLFGGLYGSDPANMPVGRSLAPVLARLGIGRSLLAPLLRRGRITPPPAISFDSGMEALPRAMARALGDRLTLGTPARAIHGAPDGWRVDTDDGRIDATDVVVTLPPGQAAALLTDAAPDAAARAGRLTSNPLAIVHLHAEGELHGLGFQVSLDDPGPLRGVTFTDSLFGRPGVYTAYLGGAGHEDVVAEDDDGLACLAEASFRRATGLEARTLAVSRALMPAWDRSWSELDGLTLPAGLHLATAWTSRPGVPGRLADAEALGARLAREPADQPSSGRASGMSSPHSPQWKRSTASGPDTVGKKSARVSMGGSASGTSSTRKRSSPSG